MKLSNSTKIVLAGVALSAASMSVNAEECGLVVTQDTTLTADVSSCQGDGIIIAADGVTLDLNGHTVSGFRTERSSGILADGVSNVTIVNGIVQSFEKGIRVQNANDVLVSGMQSNVNRQSGIFVYNSGSVVLVANKMTSNTTSGIDTLDSDVRLIGNRAESNSLYGIAMTGSGPLGKIALINNVSRGAGTRSGFLFAGGFTGGTVTFKANRSLRHEGYGFQFAGPGQIVDGGTNRARGNALGPCYAETDCPLTLR